jgi:hypothetical protein
VSRRGGVVFERKCPNQSTFLSTSHYYSYPFDKSLYTKHARMKQEKQSI